SVLEILAAQVHVRHEAENYSLLVVSGGRSSFVVAIAGWNRQLALRDARGLNDLCGRLLAEDQSERRTVFLLDSVGRVVHLECDASALGDLLGLARRKDQRLFARGDTD